MMKRKTTADDVKRVAMAALASALEESRREVRKNPRLTGVRAVATGAVLYTTGRAVFKGRQFIQERFGSDEEEPVSRLSSKFGSVPLSVNSLMRSET